MKSSSFVENFDCIYERIRLDGPFVSIYPNFLKQGAWVREQTSYFCEADMLKAYYIPYSYPTVLISPLDNMYTCYHGLTFSLKVKVKKVYHQLLQTFSHSHGAFEILTLRSCSLICETVVKGGNCELCVSCRKFEDVGCMHNGCSTSGYLRRFCRIRYSDARLNDPGRKLFRDFRLKDVGRKRVILCDSLCILDRRVLRVRWVPPLRKGQTNDINPFRLPASSFYWR